jgi:PAS domain S-box-containing protein
MLAHLRRGAPAAHAAELAIAEATASPSRPARALVERAAASARNTASFMTSFVPMLVADDERRYVDVNPAACLLIRLDREEILGLSIDDLTPPGLAEQTASLWEAFLRDGTQSGSFELYMPDGARVAVDYSAKANVEPGRHLSLLYFPASAPSRRPGTEALSAEPGLTAREREVLTLIAMGNRGRTIAERLGVSVATVEKHVRNCLRKLCARNRAHAIALALHLGEIEIRLGSPSAHSSAAPAAPSGG